MERKSKRHLRSRTMGDLSNRRNKKMYLVGGTIQVNSLVDKKL